MSAADTVHEFLAVLAPPQDQFLEIRTIVPDSQGARQTFCSSVGEAVRAALAWNTHANVYVGAAPRMVRSGSRSAIDTVVGAWADLDFHKIDPTNRDRALAIAHRRLADLDLPPTRIVFTGNGVQPWWLLTEPRRIGIDHPGELFEGINLGLARLLGGDAVHDLPRVLRVPGTMNFPDATKRERGCVPILATLLVSDGPRHDLERLSMFAVEVSSSSPHRANAPRSAVSTPPDDAVLDTFRGLLRSLSKSHSLVRTWRGDRVLQDGSRSGWDMALTHQLVRVGIRESFIHSVLKAFRLGRGMNASDGYRQRTVTKALQSKGGRDGHRRSG